MSLNHKNLETLTRIRDSKSVTPLAATNLFDSLPPLPATEMLGEWKGTCALTNHPGTKALFDLRWVGKNFNSFDDVDPIISSSPDGTGAGRVVNGVMGKARLKECKYNHVLSAAMIYNDRPIIDHFRRIDERSVMGVMEATLDESNHPLFFILERVRAGKGRL
ncbi:DUF4334 domain-containing protein [Aspergillus undulatus]|uniref:DUF4334 domain-containing protein n=1 Tax=Aspergillus undulatus TaxID=1810928 RepID=UPI003CCCE0C4